MNIHINNKRMDRKMGFPIQKSLLIYNSCGLLGNGQKTRMKWEWNLANKSQSKMINVYICGLCTKSCITWTVNACALRHSVKFLPMKASVASWGFRILHSTKLESWKLFWWGIFLFFFFFFFILLLGENCKWMSNDVD